MRDDAHSAHTEQRRTADLGVVERLECAPELVVAHADGLEHPADHRRDGLVELEDDVADEAVADHDIEGPAVAGAGGDIASFDVAEEVESRLLQETMRLLGNGVSLFGLLSNREQSDGRVRALEDVLGVHDAESRELYELRGVAIDVGAGVEH